MEQGTGTVRLLTEDENKAIVCRHLEQLLRSDSFYEITAINTDGSNHWNWTLLTDGVLECYRAGYMKVWSLRKWTRKT